MIYPHLYESAMDFQDYQIETLFVAYLNIELPGHDTTGSTLTWIFWALATQPHFQQQCYEEIRDIFGDSDRDTTHEDMKAMVLTER